MIDNTVKVFTDDNSVYCENGVFTYNIVNSKGDFIASAGSSKVEYKYNAYGEKLTSNNTSNPIGYRNYYYDSETGLYYLKARYYNASTGQFTQEDTVQDDNLQYNLYGYCCANPILYVDPSGNYSQYYYSNLHTMKETDIKSNTRVLSDNIKATIKKYIRLYYNKDGLVFWKIYKCTYRIQRIQDIQINKVTFRIINNGFTTIGGKSTMTYVSNEKTWKMSKKNLKKLNSEENDKYYVFKKTVNLPISWRPVFSKQYNIVASNICFNYNHQGKKYEDYISNYN